jgi:hypothetical protein
VLFVVAATVTVLAPRTTLLVALVIVTVSGVGPVPTGVAVGAGALLGAGAFVDGGGQTVDAGVGRPGQGFSCPTMTGVAGGAAPNLPGT